MTQNAIVIIGAGIAGLSTALRLAPLPVTIVAGEPLGTGNATAWAQGGIAAAMGADDKPEFHAEDTVAAGVGLVDPKRALHLAQHAAAQVAWLEKLGVSFDRDASGKIALGREAAHGKNRIVHAGGDGTGAAVMQTLVDVARKTPSIRFLSGWRAEDLSVEEGRVTGIVLSSDGKRAILPCRAVVLATGGIGQLFARTTNPGAACGDGLAMAARAGAKLADLEFVQFHPTALDIGRDPMPLLTEALRGDGAVLLNSEGKRFMQDEHKLAELAPRDVVARAIWRQWQEGLRPVLDARECFTGNAAGKFPFIREVCVQAGLDPAHQALPVAPAAHYHMGGVVADAYGRSSVSGFWVCGEVACVYIHGANRLASNSLLDALVYSEAIAKDLVNSGSSDFATPAEQPGAVSVSLHEEEVSIRKDLRRVMYDRLGLVREEKGMVEALRHFAALAAKVPVSSRLSSQILVSAMITLSALQRKESRGGHSRIDYPQTDAQAKHSEQTLDSFRKEAGVYLDAPWLEAA
jgi:L-aspartate oxidase